MFHFLFWGNSYGVFNFADVLIFLGALGLSLTLCVQEKGKEKGNKKSGKKEPEKKSMKNAKKLR
jgi:lipoprotein signal peptidase